MDGLATIKNCFLALQLIGVNNQDFLVEALFDTGFTDGWLAIDAQDLDALGWSLIALQVEMTTAQGSFLKCLLKSLDCINMIHHIDAT